MKRAAASVFALLALLVADELALAQGDRARVLVVSDEDGDPTASRLALELRALGLEVLDTRTPRGDSLEAIAREMHVEAVARVSRAPPAISMWVDPARFPQPDAPPVLHVDAGGSLGTDGALLALRAVELLRGRLLVVDARSPPPAPAPTMQPAPPIDAPVAPPRSDATAPLPSTPNAPPRLSITLGPAMIGSAGGVPVEPGVWLGVAFAPTTWARAELSSVPPIFSSSIHRDPGSASLRVGLLAASGSLVLEGPRRTFFSGGLGAGAIFAVFDGDAKPPATAQSGTRALFFPFGRVGAGARFAEHFALRADLLVGAVFPEAIIRIENREEAELGRPLAVGALALEVTP